MTIKSILFAVALIVAPQLHAGNFLKLTSEPLLINQCIYIYTGNPLDVALLNNGYFIVSSGKKDSEQLFTRFGSMRMDRNDYIRSNTGHFLLAVKKNSDPKRLSKIKIPTGPLAPKATHNVNIHVNLPAMAKEGELHMHTASIYDSLSKIHILVIKFTKIGNLSWKTQAFVDDVERDEGTLVFNSSGELSKQEGLHHIQWPADYDLHKLKIDLKLSTQYASPYMLSFISIDGYSSGYTVALEVTRNGEIGLIYSNGQYKKLKNRIAVAMFTNPNYLERLTDYLYRPSEKSGLPRIHWKNAEDAVISESLEEPICLKN